MALSLGLKKSTDRISLKAFPFIHGSRLFAGQFLQAVDREITMHKKAADIASKLEPSLIPNPRRPRQSFLIGSCRYSYLLRLRGSHGFRARQPSSQALGRGSPSSFSLTPLHPPNHYFDPDPNGDRGPVGCRLSP